MDESQRQTDIQAQAMEALAARLRSGERAAARELVDQYYRQMYLYMRRLGHDVHSSEDLVQESFISAWNHIGQLKNGKALNAWLYRIAGNASNRHWRRRKMKKTVRLGEFDIEDNSQTNAETVAHIEELGRLRKVVTGLSWSLREAVVLHYMQRLTIAEAAEAAGVAEGTFKSRLNRAIKVMRKQLS